ncbi:hypothetical protein POM88_028537 [Heracleum sosnowskyi]|uniref:Uncharacterized protein n=1 Tax=Heracleum sosnowskyi TaxID=360622 RepID=A0AAD8HTC6_9APIA|nr:hypothetical protein POM88_028537 [Heracleum sosnowskyi]
MAEYCSVEEDWGLQTIIRACSHNQYTTNSVLGSKYRDLFYDFPHFEELKNNDCANELDDLYKQFYDPTTIYSFSPHLEHLDSLGNEVKSEQDDMNSKVLEHNETVPVAKSTVVTAAAKYKR